MSNVAELNKSEAVSELVTNNPVPGKSLVPICEHVKDNGVRCNAPAMRNRHFCYFHSRAHRPVYPIGHPLYVPPVMESRAALQVAITHALQAVTSGNIHPKLANSIFYGIHLAAKALHMPDPDQTAAEKPAVVTEISKPMQAALEGHSAPDPAAFPPDRIVAIASFLLHPDEITKIREILQDGPRHNPAFFISRNKLSSHYIARNLLRDLGVLRQYSLDPHDLGLYHQQDPTSCFVRPDPSAELDQEEELQRRIATGR